MLIIKIYGANVLLFITSQVDIRLHFSIFLDIYVYIL